MAASSNVQVGYAEQSKNPNTAHHGPFLLSIYLYVASMIKRLIFWILRTGPLPRHVAIIMDGNRRFADRAKLERRIGHLYGYDRLVDTLEMCYELSIKVLSVYAFSIDNFKRPSEEVDALMGLLQEKLDYLARESLVQHYGVKIRVLGDLTLLPPCVRESAERLMEMTRKNKISVLNVCVAYTAREEMVNAIQTIRDEILSGGSLAIEHQHFPESGTAETCGYGLSSISLDRISAADIEHHLYTNGCPPVDLLIRTSGETRLSNFFLWQCSHAQLAFLQVLWPDFSFRHLVSAILEYQRTWPALSNQRRVERKAID